MDLIFWKFGRIKLVQCPWIYNNDEIDINKKIILSNQPKDSWFE